MSNYLTAGLRKFTPIFSCLFILMAAGNAFAAENPTLGDLAAKHGRTIGAAVVKGFDQDWKLSPSERETYLKTLKEFNLIVAENSQKWRQIAKGRDRLDFSDADAFMDLAEQMNAAVYGHLLVWPVVNNTPEWLVNSYWSREDYENWVRNYVKTFVRRYKGKVYSYDVINEAVANGSAEGRGYLDPRPAGRGKYDDFLRLALGDNYYPKIFRWAHEEDPDALLFYNDFSQFKRPEKDEGVYRLVKSIVDSGAPIHGVGFQAHMDWDDVPSVDYMVEVMQRYVDLGLLVRITELDIRVTYGSSNKAQMLQRQKEAYERVWKACLRVPECTGVTTWGFTDRHSWRADGYSDSAMLFDRNYQPNPSYYGVSDVLKNTNPGPNPPQPPQPPQPPEGPSDQQPYGGEPHTIPGRIEAEFFDEGGPGVAYKDSDAENRGGAIRQEEVDVKSIDGNGVVGWMATGEWLEYTVNVTEAGPYSVTFRTANATSSASPQLTLETGGRTLATVHPPSTADWSTLQSISVSGVELDQGEQVLRLSVDQQYVDVDYIEFVREDVAQPPPGEGTLQVDAGPDQTLVLPAQASAGSSQSPSVSALADIPGAPYPASPVITDVDFDFSQVENNRQASGSDNWPVTWASDENGRDVQYSAWGDGGGFEGGNNNTGRVSLGVARIEGDKDNIRGYNIWGGHQADNPAQFPGKSYGILSVKNPAGASVYNTLYMWVSPGSCQDNLFSEARIAYSTDHSRTWQRADWAFTRDREGVTVPTFLQFGRDYAGARDDYVYSYLIQYAPMDPVENTNHCLNIHKPGKVYLARVPKDRILERSAYQFFTGLNGPDQAGWSSNWSDRRPVFEDANGVGWNLSVSYNAGLQRYFLMTEHQDTHVGHFGLFDAPQPWGPWTTVEYTSDWGGDNTRYFYWNFSNKWLSDDGKDFMLVFTGSLLPYDAWNVIPGRFTLNESAPPPGPPVAGGVTAHLNGRVIRENITDPLTVGWSVVEGPEGIELISPSQLQTDAVFTEPGAYVLRLSASTGSRSAFDEVRITVEELGTEPGEESLPLSLLGNPPEEKTLSIPVNKPDNGENATVFLTVYDADFGDEGALYVNGNGPITLFGTPRGGDAVVVELAYETPENWWRTGTNDLRFIHSSTSGYRVDAVRVEFDGSTPPPPITPPRTDAGNDRMAASGKTVTLEGSGTAGAGGILSYRWAQIEGPSVTLQGSRQAQAQFTAPVVTATQTLLFRLTVTEGTSSDSDTVQVTVVPGEEKNPEDMTLGELAARHGKTIGAAVVKDFDEDWKLSPSERDIYLETLKEFNLYVPENSHKWREISRKKDSLDFSDADTFVALAESQGAEVYSHVLVWPVAKFTPDWLLDTYWDRGAYIDWVRNYVTTFVTRYKGRIKYYDVINEAIGNGSGEGRGYIDPRSPGRAEFDDFLREAIGDDYYKMIFEWAHQADPDALLFYNDFSQFKRPEKDEGVYRLVKRLVEEGTPIHGVGFHTHMDWDEVPSVEYMVSVMRRYTDLGLLVRFTEVDVKVNLNSNKQLMQQRQKEAYERIWKACLQVPQCTGVTTWGFSDAHNWKVDEPGDSTMPFDRNYQPNPAYYGIRDVLISTPVDNGNPSEQEPYGGEPQTIPGRIEAEFFDEGGPGVAYKDSDAENRGGAIRQEEVDVKSIDGNGVVGWMATGEWLEYTARVEQAGTYDLIARVANDGKADPKLTVTFDGQTIAEVIAPDTGGWTQFQTVRIPDIQLNEGEARLRVFVAKNWLDLDFIEFELKSAEKPPISEQFPLDLKGTPPQEKRSTMEVTKPADAAQARITMDVFDADFADEGELYINGSGPLVLFGSQRGGDEIAVQREFITPAQWWKNGTNELRFVHTRTSGYRVLDLSVDFIRDENPPPGPVAPPVADAGSDQIVESGSSTVLDGSNSVPTPADGGEYLWQQTGGETVALTNADRVLASFQAPDVESESPLSFELSVSHQGMVSRDSVSVSVLPVADPPEPTELEIERLSVEIVTDSAAEIALQTNLASAVELDYGTSPVPAQHWASSSDQTRHTISIEDLRSGADYRLRLTVKADDETEVKELELTTTGERDLLAPRSPEGLKLAAISGLTAIIEWLAPHDDDVEEAVSAYEMRLQVELGAERQVVIEKELLLGPSDPGSDEDWIVDGLIPGADYRLSLRSRDESGNLSDWSAALTWQVPLEEPAE